MNKIYVFCVCMHINITHIIDKTPKTCFPYVEKKQSPYNSHFKGEVRFRFQVVIRWVVAVVVVVKLRSRLQVIIVSQIDVLLS